jgi:membrane protease YdiL (CAAX protease family)
MSLRTPRLAATLVGLFIALGCPALLTGWSPVRSRMPTGAAADILASEGLVWGLTLAVLAIVRFWERRPFASIGLYRPTRSALLDGVVAGVALVVLATIAGAIVMAAAGAPIETGQAEFVLGLPLWVQMAVAASAGFTEEVLFRGYPIERLTMLTGRRWLGAIVPIVVFGAAHIPFWGVAHALVAGISGVWLTLLYLWRRNLWTNIAAHALTDAVAFIAVDIAGASGMTGP